VGFAAYEALRVDPGAQSLPFSEPAAHLMGEHRRDPEIRRAARAKPQQNRKTDLTAALIIVLVIAGTVLLLTAS
jgi:hypothetical protein